MNHTDVLIVGGGVVGLTTALALARLDFSVTLIEAQSVDTLMSSAKDAPMRVSALSKSSLDFLASLDESLTEFLQRQTPFQKIFLKLTQADALLNFNAAEVHEALLGRIVDHVALQKNLLQAVQCVPNITCLIPETITNITDKNDHWYIQTKNNQIILPRLLILAEGKHSTLREQLGFSVQTKDYQQTAMVADVTFSKPHHFTAWQFFLPQGPLAFLPFGEPNQYSIVWSMPVNDAKHCLEQSYDIFTEKLQQASEGQLGEVLSVSACKTFPLHLVHADTYAQAKVALIGDCAHTVHPLAGQGLNLGLADVAALVKHLEKGKAQGHAVGAYTVLRRYAWERRYENSKWIIFINGVYQNVGRNNSLDKLLGLGMSQTEKWSFLKQKLVREAMGLL